MPLRLRHQLEFSYRINLLSRKSELCDTFSKNPVPHAYLPIFDQILSLQISLVIKPSDLCELNGTGGRKGNQQRTKVLMVMKIINNKNKRGCLLSVSLFSEVSLTALFALSFKARKQKKQSHRWRCPCQSGSGFRWWLQLGNCRYANISQLLRGVQKC
jgi:hypothetical protein